MNGIKERIEKVAESILENEKLTADLADDAAQILLDWGIACAKKIAQGSLGLDDAETEEAVYLPMRATRRMMRSINNWVSHYEIVGAEGNAEALEKIIAYAGVIYGRDYIPPTSEQQKALLAQNQELVTDIPQMIANIRRFVENDKPSGLAIS